jgi:hypothetical protein
LIDETDDVLFEGYCYLRTKSKRFKKFWMVLANNHLYFYKLKEDQKHNLMHTLVGTFHTIMPVDESLQQSEQGCWPVKLMFPDNLTRTIYLESEREQHKFSKSLKEALGFRNIEQTYEFKFKIAQGSYGVINKAVHK